MGHLQTALLLILVFARTTYSMDVSGSRDKLGEAVSNQRAGNNKNDLCREMKYTI